METSPPDNLFDQRTDLSIISDAVEKLRAQLSGIIVGQQPLLRNLMAALLADGHVLIEGVPGVAKTLTAKLLARSLQVHFSRIQFTPDLMPADVIGTLVFNSREAHFQFKRGPVFTNVLLIDEINRAPAKTQSALFEVMEERQVTVDGISYGMEEPFLVLATQNPIEQEGTYRLPEAQLDRFLFKLIVPYPTLEEEAQILSRFQQASNQALLANITGVLNGADIQQMRRQVRGVVLEEKLMQFIAAIVHATRNNKNIFLGASPRASLAIMRAAQAFAAIGGRDFVTPDDVIEAAQPVLRHRIMLSPEKEMEGTTADAVITNIIGSIAVPR